MELQFLLSRKDDSVDCFTPSLDEHDWELIQNATSVFADDDQYQYLGDSNNLDPSSAAIANCRPLVSKELKIQNDAHASFKQKSKEELVDYDDEQLFEKLVQFVAFLDKTAVLISSFGTIPRTISIKKIHDCDLSDFSDD